MNNLSFPSNSGGGGVGDQSKDVWQNMAASNRNRDLVGYCGERSLTLWQGVGWIY